MPTSLSRNGLRTSAASLPAPGAGENLKRTVLILAGCLSFNRKKGTLRGMHYQIAPHAEAKLVRCTRGAIYDVIIDLRPGSPTFKQWVATELTIENRKMLYIPEEFAHGFQILENNTEIFYQMSEFYQPECARGVRWDEPAFGIEWLWPNPIMSERDKSYLSFNG